MGGGGMGDPMAHLGMMIFFDPNLSEPNAQSCASCHAPGVAFADPNQDRPVSAGAVSGRFGTRNSPSAAYAAQIPPFRMVNERYVGGQFWDGRAADLVAQAKGPFLDQVEMANPSKSTVVRDVKSAHYGMMFTRVFGSNAFKNVDKAYDNIAVALAAYERSPALNRFDSKFDYSLRGQATLTEQEARGLALFNGERANCSSCHPTGGDKPILSSYVYENLGVPVNPEIAKLRKVTQLPPDLGLGGVLKDSAQNGKFRVPSVRNVAKTAPFGHNGYFTSLKQTVHFMNTAGVSSEWAKPEVTENVERIEVGNRGLTAEEEDAIVAFLGTLSDGYVQQ